MSTAGHTGEVIYGAAVPVPVLIASDVRLLREGLHAALGPAPGVEPAGTAADADATIAAVRRLSRGVVLLDMSMAGAADLASHLVAGFPNLRVVALAVGDNVDDVVACAEAGLAGYIPREASLDDLCDTVRRVARGETPCSGRVAAGLFQRVADLSAERARRPAPAWRLTPRELEVLQLVDRGLSNKQIAARLQIALPTVKNHVHRILEKLGVDHRGEAAHRLRV